VVWLTDLRDGERNSQLPRPTAGREGIQPGAVHRLAGEDQKSKVCLSVCLSVLSSYESPMISAYIMPVKPRA